jgi:hypothetical protein
MKDTIAFGTIVGAISAALVGSLVMGILLGVAWIELPWSRAFAVGLFGGAAAGLPMGAVFGWIYEQSQPKWPAYAPAVAVIRTVARPVFRPRPSMLAVRG